MSTFITTFESVAILLGIGLVGFYIIRRNMIPAKVLSMLSPLALEIALPSLIFVDIITDFTLEKYPNWWQIPLWWVFFTAVAAVFTFIFCQISKKKTKREFALALFYQNGIFFPLAILSGMFGADSSYLITLFLFTLFFPAFFFSTYSFFFPEKQRQKVNLKKIFHPVLIATILAISLEYIGIRELVPNLVKDIFNMLGAMSLPLLMIILGGSIYADYKTQGLKDIKEISKFVLVKNILFPLAFILILILIKPYVSYRIALILLLQAAVPPVTALPIVTERMKGNRTIVSQFMVSSFILSLISIPFMIYIFNIFF
ncbi:MAG: AEC family transporter [Candidatus Cloacimonetes bacterium]|nr:AEC family transporter [Candidatus Cloacimonadota bacterium]